HGVNGWQIGGGFESDDEAEQDAHDLESLYDVLLDEVVPTYYDDREKWTEMMRASIQSTRDRFSARRMVEEYVARLYRDGAAGNGQGCAGEMATPSEGMRG